MTSWLCNFLISVGAIGFTFAALYATRWLVLWLDRNNPKEK